MKQLIKTFHNYSDKEVNDDIASMTEQGWFVRQFEYFTQNVNGQIRACIILLYEIDGV